MDPNFNLPRSHRHVQTRYAIQHKETGRLMVSNITDAPAFWFTAEEAKNGLRESGYKQRYFRIIKMNCGWWWQPDSPEFQCDHRGEDPADGNVRCMDCGEIL